jgi:hypothetical protein
VQSPKRETVPNRSLTESHGLELATGDYSVLLRGERGDPALGSTCVTFGLYAGLNLTHPGIEADEMCRVGRGW